MPEPIVVVPYDAVWPVQFQTLGQQLRMALQQTALRIDHIGSTSVPGLAAKPVLDIQISVATLEPVGPYQQALEGCSFIWRADNPDLTKRYFREQAGRPRTHIHVRRSGSWSEQFALLFRDYLRANAKQAEQYARLKYQLAQSYPDDREGYVTAKEPTIWQIMQQASQWSQAIGWEPATSDC